MRAEIISIGDELLLGHTINLDATLIAQEMASLGIETRNIQTVGDNVELLQQALMLAATRSEIIITTGGLGPTDDDLTKQAIANFAGVKLLEHKESLIRLSEYFDKRIPGANQYRQACLPEGCTVFNNEIGTAPGCALVTMEGKIIIILPGPPYEMQKMLQEQVRPYLAKKANSIIYSNSLHVFGMGEGRAGAIIADLMTLKNPVVAPYAKGGEMFVKITARAENHKEAEKINEPIIKEIQARLGDVIYGIDTPSLELVVVKGLREKGYKIATAESCTGGLLAKRITDIPGSSEVFDLGVITYANMAKERQLNVQEEMLHKYGAVSGEVARQMAQNIRKLANSDLGIGITGVAGPDGGTSQKPVGLVYIALADGTDCVIRKMEPQGKYLGREFVRERASSYALDMVRRYLQGLPILFEWK